MHTKPETGREEAETVQAQTASRLEEYAQKKAEVIDQLTMLRQQKGKKTKPTHKMMMGYLLNKNKMVYKLHDFFNTPEKIRLNKISPKEITEMKDQCDEGSYKMTYIKGNLGKLEEMANIPLVKKIPIETDTEYFRVRDDQKELFNRWRFGNRSKDRVFQYLIEKQEENGSFRNWLEEQEETKKVKAEFEKLGLNYEAWDNPRYQFGLKDSKAEMIRLDDRKLVTDFKKVMRKLTRGEYKGFLTISPKEFWKQIASMYKQLEDNPKEMIERILEKTEENILEDGGKITSDLGKDLKDIVCKLDGDASKDREYEYILKTWRREPSYDFTEGNDAGICLKYESTESYYIGHYIVDRSVCMMDLYLKGKRRGHMIYMAAESTDGKPVLVVEGFDISQSMTDDYPGSGAFQLADEAMMRMAKDVGFNKIFYDTSCHHECSKEFMRYMQEKHRLRYKSLVLTKVEEARPISILDSITGNPGHHYFDFGDTLRQDSSWENINATGLILEVPGDSRKPVPKSHYTQDSKIIGEAI